MVKSAKAGSLELAKRALAHLDTNLKSRTINDYSNFFGMLADDVVFEYASPDGAGAMRTKKELVDYVTNLFGTLSGPETSDDVRLSRPLEFFPNGNRVVVLWAECAVDARSGEPGPSKEAVAIFDFDDDEVVRLRKFSQ
ncbi:hypothetical protein BAY59_22760 [Prauserella coralliicola]|nr:hypothetical protein BAY59_22760 [Prauserella coralliicola]